MVDRQDSSDGGESISDARVEGTSIKPPSHCVCRRTLTYAYVTYGDIVV